MIVFLEGVSEGTPRDAVAVNLSRTGVLLTTDAPFRADDPILVRLRRTLAASADEHVIAGRVVRIETDRGIGVRFDVPISDDLLPAAEHGR